MTPFLPERMYPTEGPGERVTPAKPIHLHGGTKEKFSDLPWFFSLQLIIMGTLWLKEKDKVKKKCLICKNDHFSPGNSHDVQTLYHFMTLDVCFFSILRWLYIVFHFGWKNLIGMLAQKNASEEKRRKQTFFEKYCNSEGSGKSIMKEIIKVIKEI